MVFNRQLYKQKPQAWGPVTSVQSSIFKNAERVGFSTPTILDPFWQAVSRNYINNLAGTIYDYGNLTTYQKNYLSLGVTANNKQNNYYQNLTPLPTTQHTLMAVLRVTSLPASYTGVCAALIDSSSPTKAYAGLLYSSTSISFAGKTNLGYTYTTDAIDILNKWAIVIGKWDAATKSNFKVFVKILDENQITSYTATAASSSSLTYDFNSYDYYQVSGNAQYSNYYDTGTDVSLMAVWPVMLSDSQCMYAIDNPYFLLHRVPPVFYSVPDDEVPPTFNPLFLNAAQPTRVIQ